MAVAKRYTKTEKKRYFQKMSKPGAKFKNGKKVSDFSRGQYSQKAKALR